MAVRRMAPRSSHEKPMTKPKRDTSRTPRRIQPKSKHRKTTPSAIHKTAARGEMRSGGKASGASTVADPTGRSNTKQAKVIAMLRSPGGATIDTMIRATKWQPHSVRGFLAAVVRKKLALNLLSEDAKTGRVYRITEGRGPLPGKAKTAKAA